MSKLYPLKFKTIFKEKIWGGNKINSFLNKDYGSLANCGETWELSSVKGNVSQVSNGSLSGRDLDSVIDEFKGELVGDSVYERFGNEFPLLIKFIDAKQDLSVQVHPDDALAKERHNGFGKTEMWYIMQADEGATLISGFNREIDKATYLEYFESGRLNDILNKEEVQGGDVFFIPAGRVHTIGKGILLAEIQQTSDTTYRIYDFDRRDSEGQLRELHVEEAVDAIDYNFHEEYKTAYQSKDNEVNSIVQSPYFLTNKLNLTQSIARNYAKTDSFVIYICLEGQLEIMVDHKSYNLNKGDVYLIPATIDQVELIPKKGAELLEVTYP